MRHEVGARRVHEEPVSEHRGEVALPRAKRAEEPGMAEPDVHGAVAACAQPFERATRSSRLRREMRVDPRHDVADHIALPDARPFARVGIDGGAGHRHHRDKRRRAP